MFDNSVDVVKFVEISDEGVNEVEGKYATTRLKFLLNFKEEFLEQLIKDDMLENHLITIQLQAENRYNELIEYNKVRNLDSNILEQIEFVSENQVEEELIFV